MELQIPLPTLHHLTAHPEQLGGWTPVIADLARQTAHHEHDAEHDEQTADTTTDPARRDSHTAGETGTGDKTRSDGGADTSGEAGSAPNSNPVPGRPNTRAQDGGGRTPGKPMRRHTEIRDRTCTGPRCRAPAHSTDGDHIKEWARGGPTTETNIHSACRHDHRLRHQGGWTVRRSNPGHITWTSRLGIHYHVRPQLIIQPLPNPIPRDPAPPDPNDELHDQDVAPIWRELDAPTDAHRRDREPTERPPPNPDEPIPF